MKIEIIETDARGGLIHFAYHLADAMAETGCEVTLVTGRDYELSELPHSFSTAPILRFWPQFEKTKPLNRSRIRHSIVRPVQRSWRAFVLLREWIRLTNHLLRRQPNVVVFSIIRFPFLFIFLKILSAANIKLVQVCHEFKKRDTKVAPWRDRLEATLFEKAYRCFDTIFFLSQSTRDEFLGYYPKSSKTCVVPHPAQQFLCDGAIDPDILRSEFGIGKHERVVLFFGLLRPSKGVEHLVEAFGLLDDIENLRLVVSGYPNKLFDTDALLEAARWSGIESRTTFHFDYLPNEQVVPLMQLADVVVFPYLNATASGSLALAQSLGRPVVATQVSGLEEAVENEVTGLLVPVAQVAALAAAIRRTLEQPEASIRMAEAAKKLYERERSWSVVAKLILDEVSENSPAPLPGTATKAN